MTSGPLAAPWTGLGQLQGDVSRLQSELRRKADSHEVSSLKRDVDRLERANGELRSEIDGLHAELQTFREEMGVRE